jgi:hypothetical protein
MRFFAFPCKVIEVDENNTERLDLAHKGNPLKLTVQTYGDEVFAFIEDDDRLFGPDYEIDPGTTTGLAVAIGGRLMRVERSENCLGDGMGIAGTPTIVTPMPKV